MKFRLLTSIIFIILVKGTVYSQTSLRTQLDKISRAYDVTFSYADDLIDRLSIDSINLTSLNADLKSLRTTTGLDFGQPINGIIAVTAVSRQFCIKVLDSESEDIVVGSQLHLRNEPSNNISNTDGEIHFNTSLTYLDTLSIKTLGYDDGIVLVGSLSNDNCTSLKLSVSTQTLDEVIISYMSNGINASLEDHSLSIDPKSLALLPGETDGDLLLAIKTLPGINAPNGKAGNLHIRGSTTDQTLILFDDIPIYHKGHYFGAISPYNPTIVDKANIYRGGFEAEIGGRVGGAIDLHSSKKMADSAEYRVGLNSYYGSAYARLPISQQVTVNAAVRSTYAPDWQSPKLEAINEMVFQPSLSSIAEDDPNLTIQKNDFSFYDANLNMTLNTSKSQGFISLLDVGNKYNLVVDRGSSTETQISELDNSGINMKWLTFWNTKIHSQVSFTRSKYTYLSSIIVEPNNNAPSAEQEFFDNSIDDIILKGSVKNYFNPEKNQQSFNIGYEWNQIIATDVGRTREGPRRDSREQTSLHSIHTSFDLYPENWSLKFGVRGNYYEETSEFRIEPRLFINYALNESWTIKSNFGMYSQYLNQLVFFDFDDLRSENLVWRFATDELPVIKSKQGMLGGIFNKSSLLIDMEFYLKRIENLATNSPVITPRNQSRFVTGDLEVWGLDLLIRKKWNSLDTWISYSLISTNMVFPQLNELDFITYYDQPHTFNFTATIPWRKWNFSLGWSFSSGVPNYLGTTFFPDPGPVDEVSNTPRRTPAQTNNGRFPAQHQLDFAATFDFATTKKWSGTLGLSILNVYDRDNLIERTNYELGQMTSLQQRYAIGFAPNLMVTLSW